MSLNHQPLSDVLIFLYGYMSGNYPSTKKERIMDNLIVEMAVAVNTVLGGFATRGLSLDIVSDFEAGFTVRFELRPPGDQKKDLYLQFSSELEDGAWRSVPPSFWKHRPDLDKSPVTRSPTEEEEWSVGTVLYYEDLRVGTVETFVSKGSICEDFWMAGPGCGDKLMWMLGLLSAVVAESELSDHVWETSLTVGAEKLFRRWGLHFGRYALFDMGAKELADYILHKNL